MIHKEERITCVINAFVGGVLAIFYFFPSESSLAEYVMLFLFGGNFGAVFGIAHYKIFEVAAKCFPILSPDYVPVTISDKK